MGNKNNKKKGEIKRHMNEQEKMSAISEAPSWSELPALFIKALYQNLSDADKVSMSLVCRTWSEGFNDPSLWRARVFNFDGGSDSDDNVFRDWLNRDPPAVNSGKLAVRFARRFARHMRKVDIHIFLPFDSPTESVSDLNTFAELFGASVLKKIRIYFLNDPPVTDSHKLNEEFLRAFIRLLENQNSLEKFFISGVSFNFTQGVQLLRCLAQTCGETLQKLSLECFLSPHLETVHNTGPLIDEIKKFSNLTIVELDSECISDDLLHAWSQKCPKLRVVEIFVSHQNYALSCKAWQALVNTRPDLSVYMVANGEPISSIRILCPDLPLASIVWDGGLIFTAELEFTRFLNYLACYENTLKRLYVKFIAKFGDPDKAAVMRVLSHFIKLPPLTLKRYRRRSKIWIIEDENEY